MFGKKEPRISNVWKNGVVRREALCLNAGA
jgi:hypothetical protein